MAINNKPFFQPELESDTGVVPYMVEIGSTGNGWSGTTGDYTFTVPSGDHGISITNYNINVITYNSSGDRIWMDYNVDNSDNITVYSPVDIIIHVTIK